MLGYGEQLHTCAQVVEKCFSRKGLPRRCARLAFMELISNGELDCQHKRLPVAANLEK